MPTVIDDLVCNPAQFAPDLFELSLSGTGLKVVEADFGEAVIEAAMIRRALGEEPADRHWPNKEMTFKLRLSGEGEVDLATVVHQLEATVSIWQRPEGGWLERVPKVGGNFGAVACQVKKAALSNISGWQKGDSPDVTLTLITGPFWYSTVEVESEVFTETEARELVFELSDVLGTAPGLIRLRVTNENEGQSENEGDDWRGLICALESRDHPQDATKDTTAALAYDAADLTPKGGAEATGGIAPEVRAVGAVASGTGAISPGLPIGMVTGDLLIMVAESGGATAGTEANTALTAAGWSAVPGAEAQKKGNTRLTLLYKIASGGDATTMNDTGDHQVGRIVGIKAGTFDSANPFNVAGVGTQAATKSVSIPGATTTRARCLVLACASGHLPDATTTAEFGAATNASLTGLTELIDNTVTAGDGGALYAVSGVKEAKGAYSATTCTAVTEAERGVISVAINAPYVVRHGSLTAGWLTILDSEIAGVGHQTHKGVRRLWMRGYDPGTEAGDVQLRIRWRALGSVSWSEDNAIVPMPFVDDWALLDMGECRPEQAVLGDERWEWQLQARALSGAGVIDMHKVYPLPVEQMVVVRTPDVSQGADTQSQKSPGTAANVAGVGSVAWLEAEKAKASDNVYATAALDYPNRSNWLRATDFGFAIPEGATIVDVLAECEGKASESFWTDLEAQLVIAGAGAGNIVENIDLFTTTDKYKTVIKSLAATGTTATPTEANAANFGVQLSVALAHVGEATASIDHIRITIYYTEAADENRVCFATRSIEPRTDGVYRQVPGEDDVWGRVPEEGFLPYAPPSGLEERAMRGIVIASQGDLDALADSSSNKLSAQVFYRAGFLFSREAA